MKKCSQCDVEKEVSDFYVKRGGGVLAHCKACVQYRSATWYQANKIRAQARDRKAGAEKRSRIKEATFAAYGGYVCACCGEKERKFLTLDHINNDGAAQRKAMYGNRNAAGSVTYAWLVNRGFPSGYQILCMNCNYGKRMNNGVCPHKTVCNDQAQAVGPSGPKHVAPILKVVGAG